MVFCILVETTSPTFLVLVGLRRLVGHAYPSSPFRQFSLAGENRQDARAVFLQAAILLQPFHLPHRIWNRRRNICSFMSRKLDV